jgi:hypothetical protein
MAQQLLTECSFLIPSRRDGHLSDGELHSTAAWEWLDDELYGKFGGRTIAPGWYEGFYRDPDTRHRVDDRSRKYIVAVPGDAVGNLRTLLVEACVVFQQKCIYLSIAGQVELVEGRTP